MTCKYQGFLYVIYSKYSVYKKSLYLGLMPDVCCAKILFSEGTEHSVLLVAAYCACFLYRGVKHSMLLVATCIALFSDSYSNRCSMLLVVIYCIAFLDGKGVKHSGPLVAAYHALFSDSHS